MSKLVRWGKPNTVFAELNKNNLEASAHQVNALIWNKNDGRVKFREQFPSCVFCPQCLIYVFQFKIHRHF